MSLESPLQPVARIQPEPSRGWLINRNFTLLALGQAISNVGDFVYSTTLLIWVYALGGSTAAVSGVLVAQYMPIFVLGPIAGVFVDRWHRLHTMLASDLTRTVIALLPLVVPGALRLPAIYCSVFLISAISRFFQPALSAVTQVVVPDQQQPQAASIGQATQALSIVIGPALASPLYFLVGPEVAVLINAASYALSALCLWMMRVPRADLLPSALQSASGALRQNETSRGTKAVFHELFDGVRFVLKTRILLVVTLLGLFAMFGAGAINSLDIVFVSQRLHASPNLYGYLTAVAGLGMLLGAITAGLLSKHMGPRLLLAGSLGLVGLGIVIYALQTSFVLALVFSFLMSIPQGGINVGMGPIFMWVTPRHLMGRVQGVFGTAMYGASLLAIALAGTLGVFVPAYLLLLSGGVMIVLSGLIGWLALPSSLQSVRKASVPGVTTLPGGQS